MRRLKHFMLAVAIIVVSAHVGLASEKGSHHAQMKGNNLEAQKDVAINGFCPVCILSGKYMKGKSDHSVEYEGKTYYFPSEKQKRMFLENPKRWTENLEEKFMELKTMADEGKIEEMKGSHKGGSHERKGSGY